MRGRTIYVAAVLISGMFAVAPAARAAVIDLADKNASVRFDTGDSRLTLDWVVDTVDQVFQQTFFLSVNGQPQENVTTLDATPSVTTVNTNFDLAPDRTTIVWTNSLVAFSTQFTLRGGSTGGGDSTLSELIKVTNVSQSAITIRLFQYVDFNLTGSANDDTGLAIAPLYNMVRQFDANASVAETVVTPAPNAYEVNLTTNAGSIIGRLSDNSQLASLGSVSGPVTGNVEWSFQWDVALNPGDTFLISKVKALDVVPFVPEPASLALLGVGALFIVKRRR